MKFYAKIFVRRSVRGDFENIEVAAEHFEAPTVQAAKARLTKTANNRVLFSYIQSWDDEKAEFTGKDLHWKQWGQLVKSMNNTHVVTRKSEIKFGETHYRDPSDPRDGVSVEYIVSLILYF